MNTIHVLPPALIAKIAAGEIIERPAYVVKELVENSLDAEADHISIEISKGGIESIIVTDNGRGMSAADLFLSWQRHTTSKTLPDSDLTNIATLGFRGEALSSIAAVSDLTIQSRLASEPGGTKLELSHGKLLQSSPVGRAPGTTVRADHIFSSLPARQKFLASVQTEWHHIVHHIEAQALAFPQVRFSLKHNGKLIFDAPIQTRIERMRMLLGEEIVAESFPFNVRDPYISIEGFLGTPQISFQNSVPSYLVVNNRVVKNKAISQAIKNSYRTLLKVDANPFYLLYVQLPYEMVDVNIHPRKEEIKFLNERALAKNITTHITALADRQSFTFRWSTPKGDTKSFAAREVKADVLARLQTRPKETPVIQLHNLYLVTETEHGLLLIDQHAAHERILYEQLYERYLTLHKKQTVVQFPQPKKLSLPLSQSTMLENNFEVLAGIGFTLEKSGTTEYLIHAVPELFQDRNITQLFQEILGDLEHAAAVSEVDAHTNRMLSYLACRMAIKGGEELSEVQIKKLLHELSLTKLAYTCPHGRPTHIEMSLHDLEKAFGRK